MVEWLQMTVGEDARVYTIVLFTYGDCLNGKIEEYLKTCPKLEKLVNECNGLCHVFQNEQQDNDQIQVQELLEKRKKKRNQTGGKKLTPVSQTGGCHVL